MAGSTGPTGPTGVSSTGPAGITGSTGPAISFFSSSIVMPFVATTGVQTITQPTGLSTTIYPQIFLTGFQQVGSVATASVTEIYFINNGGVWDVVMSAENTSGNSYTINYYYK
jgi:hypothetical protein